MDSETNRRPDIYKQIERLVEEYRPMCLWSAPRDYLPKTDEERLAALADIERYGDRAAFKRSRELREWLLQSSRKL